MPEAISTHSSSLIMYGSSDQKKSIVNYNHIVKLPHQLYGYQIAIQGPCFIKGLSLGSKFAYNAISISIVIKNYCSAMLEMIEDI